MGGKVGRRGGVLRGKGQVWEEYRMPKGLLRLQKSLVVGGWWVAEIKYSVCPRPFMRPREA